MSETRVDASRGSYLLPHFEHATVGDAMHPGILSCDAEATLTDVARLMSTHRVHCIAVRGAAESKVSADVWGVISDLDLLRAGLSQDAPETIAGLALAPIASVETSMALSDAAQVMVTNSTSHLLAVNPETQYPVGILSTLDIAWVLGWGDA